MKRWPRFLRCTRARRARRLSCYSGLFGVAGGHKRVNLFPALLCTSNKPHRVRAAVDILDADNSACVLVGDTAAGVFAGLLAGVAVIGWQSSITSGENWAQRARHTCQSRCASRGSQGEQPAEVWSSYQHQPDDGRVKKSQSHAASSAGAMYGPVAAA